MTRAPACGVRRTSVDTAGLSCPTVATATVVIPTLNARELLRDALASLAGETVVVVDNASTDGTAELVERDFPGVRLLRNEENLGFGRAVNLGAAAAESDVLV